MSIDYCIMQGYVNLNSLSFDANFFFLIFEEPNSIYMAAGCLDICYRFKLRHPIPRILLFCFVHTEQLSPNTLNKRQSSSRKILGDGRLIPSTTLFVFLSIIFPTSVFQWNIFLLAEWEVISFGAIITSQSLLM